MITIYPTIEEAKRIAFFDRLVSYGTEELQEVMEAEEIIWKLKGKKPEDSGVIRKLVDNNNYLTTEIINARSNVGSLQSELFMLKEDFKKLIKAVNTLATAPMPYSQELYELKQKNQIY